jgi:hypothetical protein
MARVKLYSLTAMPYNYPPGLADVLGLNTLGLVR